ncbi:MAG: ribonuclease J [Gammaproteobacteria bacterium]
MTINPYPKKSDFMYVPLGGTGEIGINMNLYGHDGAWLMVDCGMMLDRQRADTVLLPDPAFARQLGADLRALLLTHAHLDHIGAVPDLWAQLRCPIYATPFTAAVVRQMAQSYEPPVALDLRVVRPGTRHTVGPFDIEWITLTHSTPEPSALLLRTPAGSLFHTGDWKLDDHPVLGANYDAERLSELQSEAVLAMICDSTNALVDGESGSESELYEPLRRIAQSAEGRVLVSCFSSNIARLSTLARVARATGRRLSLHGRALERMLSAARAVGYWKEEDAVVARHDAGYLPPEEVLAVVTGSQGEPQAALAKLARDAHPELLLDPTDTVVFSSRKIPGNEPAIESLQRRLRERGIRVFTAGESPVHVSGHPARGELKRMFDWVRPGVVVPTHGEPQHLEANARWARSCGVALVVRARNGDVVELAAGQPGIRGHVHSGRIERALLHEPAKAEPAKAEPAKAEPAKAEPAKE